MTLRTGHRRRAGMMPAVPGAWAALTGLLAWLIWHPLHVISVPPCVSPRPGLAWLGVRMALLHSDPNCPTGQLAFGPSAGHSASLVVMVTIPTLLLNLWVLLSTVGFGVALRRLVARLAEMVRSLLPRTPAAPRLVVTAHTPDARPSAQPLRPWQLAHSLVRRRGPPVALAS